MIKIAVSTATRAEYGLMRQLLFRLQSDPDFDLSLLVTGTHLSDTFGKTVNEIENDGLPIAAQIDIIEETNGVINVANTFSNAVSKFSAYFAENHFDYLLVDGDRYETLAIVIAAVLSHITIVHCGGGETTEGANDEYWRHAITKISNIHFPTMEIYRQRIIQMGENPNWVYTVGSMGLENIRCMRKATLHEIEESIQLRLTKPFALVTFHPVTMENHSAAFQIKELLAACDKINDMMFIFTKANADEDGLIINDELDKYVESHRDSSVCVSSLGAYLYLSAMSYCEFVLGNSSSGLIETPSFGIPTVNIGDRQKGREKADSIIDCSPKCDDILAAICKARDVKFRNKCKSVKNPNGDGYTSEHIVSCLKRISEAGVDTRVKHFYMYSNGEGVINI